MLCFFPSNDFFLFSCPSGVYRGCAQRKTKILNILQMQVFRKYLKHLVFYFVFLEVREEKRKGRRGFAVLRLGIPY